MYERENKKEKKENKNQELLFYLEREIKRLKEIFKKTKLRKKDKETEEIWDFLHSYFSDALFFYEKKEYVKAFELVNYVWGILEIMAALKIIEVPQKLKKYFKLI